MSSLTFMSSLIKKNSYRYLVFGLYIVAIIRTSNHVVIDLDIITIETTLRIDDVFIGIDIRINNQHHRLALIRKTKHSSSYIRPPNSYFPKRDICPHFKFVSFFPWGGPRGQERCTAPAAFEPPAADWWLPVRCLPITLLGKLLLVLYFMMLYFVLLVLVSSWYIISGTVFSDTRLPFQRLQDSLEDSY